MVAETGLSESSRARNVAITSYDTPIRYNSFSAGRDSRLPALQQTHTQTKLGEVLVHGGPDGAERDAE